MHSYSRYFSPFLLIFVCIISGCDSFSENKSELILDHNKASADFQTEKFDGRIIDNVSPKSSLLLTSAELFLSIIDSQSDPVGGIIVYAVSTSQSVSQASEDYFIQGNGNWLAEIWADDTQDVLELDPQVDYILYSEEATNQIWFRWESEDTSIDLVLDEQPEFELDKNDSSSIVEFVNASIESIDLGTTPFTAGTQSEIEWDVEWNGHGSTPEFYPTNAKVELVSSSGLTLLSSAETQFSGTGSILWTPLQTYTDAKIRVTDNFSGSVKESGLFNVIAPPPLEVEVSGPSVVALMSEEEWISDVDYGLPPYDYLWEFMPLCSELQLTWCNQWHFGGEDDILERAFDAEGEYIIRLTVTDALENEENDTKEITVSDF